MVRERLSTSRPGMTTGLVVHVDNKLAYHHSVGKGEKTRAPFEFAIYDKAGHQALMNRTHVADGVPNKLLASLDLDFFMDGSHRISVRLWYARHPYILY